MKEILENINKQRNISQAQVIGSLLWDADLVSAFQLDKQTSLFTDEGKFYISMFYNIYALGYESFDSATIHSYLDSKPEMYEKYVEMGGWDTLENIKAISHPDAVGGAIQNLQKQKYLLDLHYELNMDFKDDYDKLELMTLAEVYAYYEYKLASISSESALSSEESLVITDEDIDFIRSGHTVGHVYSNIAPLLNDMTLGIPKGELTVFASFINEGKTSFLANMLFDQVRNGKKVGVIANESNAMDFKQLMVIYVLTNELGYYNLSRRQLKSGKLTKEDEKAFIKAVEIVNEKYAPNIRFREVYHYNISIDLQSDVRRWATTGTDIIAYDTLKADHSDSAGWEELIEASKTLYQLASRLDVAIIANMQLKMAEHQKARHLSLGMLANGKQAMEVASEGIFFRQLYPDEVIGESHEVKAFRNEKRADGSIERVEIELDSNKQYAVFFLVKSRNGRTGLSTLIEFNGDFNRWEEIGYAEVKLDAH